MHDVNGENAPRGGDEGGFADGEGECGEEFLGELDAWRREVS